MSSGYGRALSPPRTNRYHPPAGPPGRASAGSFFPSPAYDPYGPPPRTSRDYIPGPRISDERIAGPRLLPPRARSPPRRSSVDDYDVPLRVRPRNQTLEPDVPRTRRPLSMIAPSMAAPSSPTRTTRPIITNAVARPPSPIMKTRRDRRDEDYEVLPASSTSRRHHQRHSSLNTTDPGRLMAQDREARERSYRVSGSGRPPIRERQGENDQDYGFEYTEGREPKLQGPTYRQRSRRDSVDTARPRSMVLDGGYIPRSERGAGPPMSSRGFESIGRSESLRQPSRVKDEDRATRDYARDDRDVGSRKVARSEITLHQPSTDGHTQYPEEEPRHHRSRIPASEDYTSESKNHPRKQTLEEDDRFEPKARLRRQTLEEDDRLESKSRPRKQTSEEDRLTPKSRDAHDDRGAEDRPRRHRHKHRHRDHSRHGEDSEIDGRRHRVRDEPRERRDVAENGGSSSGLLPGAVAATAGAGLAAEEVRRHRHKDRDAHDDHTDRVPRDDVRERSSRRDHGDKDPRHDHRESQPRVDLRDRNPQEEDLRPKVDLRDRNPQEEDQRPRVDLRDRNPREEANLRPPRRPHDHLRESDRDHLDAESLSTSLSISEREDLEYQEAKEASRRAKEHAEVFVGPVDPVVREQRSFERRPEDDAPRHHRSYRPRRHHNSTRDEDSWSESSFSSSSDSEEDNYHRPAPRVVTPANDENSEPKPPPKGILRKPREQFPEYPATVREGVAPHKDDKKKDVPRNARWTKIDRRLVNPEALEQDGVRFNEFVDHVIVLKVMDREEIEKYTQKTAEIRANRRLLTGPETQAHMPAQPDQPFVEPPVSERGVRF